jgi:hypothetical protein
MVGGQIASQKIQAGAYKGIISLRRFKQVGTGSAFCIQGCTLFPFL